MFVASGGGLTTEFSTDGVRRRISAAGSNGESGIARRGFCAVSDQATTFGIASSRFTLILGGVTIVWERLSLSGGTEMTG
jgi:hypothetical protein